MNRDCGCPSWLCLRSARASVVNCAIHEKMEFLALAYVFPSNFGFAHYETNRLPISYVLATMNTIIPATIIHGCLIGLAVPPTEKGTP